MTLQRERPKFLAAFLGAATLAAWSAPASAETVRVRNIQVSETAGNTAVVIAASARPTFTTWKLEQPARVVVELSGARLGNVDVPLDAGTYAVGLVSASVTEDDSAGPRTRIVLTLRQASDYQVEAKGNDITLRVVPRARPPVATHETAEARLQIEARAKIEAQAKTEAQAQAKAEAQAKTEAQAQTKVEAQAKTEAQAQTKVEAQAKTEAQAQAKAEAQAKTEAQAQAKIEAQAKTVAQAQAKAEAKAKTEAQAQAKAEAQAKTEAQAQAKIEAQAKTEAQAQTKVEAQAKTEAQAQAKAEAKERALAQSRADAQAKLAAQAQAEIQERALAQRKTESLLKDEAKERLAAQVVAEKHSRAEAAARLEADRLRKELADAHQETAKARAEASAANQESQRQKLALAQAETQVKQAQSEAERARKRADAAENEAIAARRRETERDKALRVASEEVNARQKTLDRIAQKQEAQQSRLAAAERLVSERETTVRESASRLAEREEAARTARARRDSLARDASKSSKAEAAAALAEAERQHKNAASAAEQSRQELARAVASRRQEEARTEQQANLRRAEENKLDKAVAGRKAEESRLADARAERARLDEEKSKLESERAQLETTRNALLAEVNRLKTTVSTTTAALAKPEKTGEGRGNVTAPAAKPAQTASTPNAQPLAVASPPVANRGTLGGFAVPSAPATPTPPLLASRAPSQLAALAPSRAAAPNLPAMVRSPAGREQSSPASHANRPVPAELVRTTPATSAPAARPVAAAAEPVNTPTSAGRPRSVTLRALSHIRSIDFVDEPNRASVIIDVDNSTIFSIERTAGRRLSLRIEHSELPESLARNLDATEYLGPVKIISSYRDPAARTTVRVDVDLAEDVPNRVRLDGNRIFWDFQKAPAPSLPAVWVPPPSVMFVPARKVAGFFATAKDGLWVGQMAPLPYLAPPVSAPPADTGSAPAQPAASAPEGRQGATGPSGRYAAIGKKRYTGRRIDLDFKGADIHNILRLLADVGQVNVIVADDVRGDVTIKMRDVPWDQALDVVLRSKGLGSVREGNLLRVAPLALLEKELEAEIARQKQIADVLPIETRLIGVSYAEAANLLDKIRDLLSPRGKVSQDHRTNTLIVSDVTKNLQLIEDLVRNLDTQTSQVVIEARIVEADTNFARQIGVQWGGTAFADTTHGNPTGLVFPYNVGVGGGADDGSSPLGGLVPGPRTGTGTTGNPNFLVNMPAPAGAGVGSAIGLTLGSVAGAFNLNLRLSAMESTGTVRILSSPRVTTMDNIEAHIEQGVSIPVSVVSAMGAQTQFVDAKLSLAVKPHVTNEGTIAMVINVTRNEPDFVNTGARGDPSIQKKEAKTTMLVRDGDTAVIGGIYTRNTGLSFARVPFFSDIPVLGWFFRNRKENDNRSEFLVFITPRIVNRSHATGQ
jgi:type IV pilus assembly protein PilQ